MRRLARVAGAARLVTPGSSFSQWRQAAAAAAAAAAASTSTTSSSTSSAPSQPSNKSELQQRRRGRRRFDALLIDATGTLISPSEPVTHVYRSYAAKHGIDPIPSTPAILAGFRRAYNAPWPPPRNSNRNVFFFPASDNNVDNDSSSSSSSSSSTLAPRFAGGGRPFWRSVVAHSLGFQNPRALPDRCFEDIYDHFSRKEAWRFAAPGVKKALKKIRGGGVRVAVVSNFDSRLPKILGELGVLPLVDACVVSGNHGGAEKPGPVLFDEAFRALRALGPVAAPDDDGDDESGGGGDGGGDGGDGKAKRPLLLERARTLVVGDDRRNDVTGGRAAGFLSWHWGTEVRSLKSLAARVLGEVGDDDDDDDDDVVGRGEESDDDDDDEDDAA